MEKTMVIRKLIVVLLLMVALCFVFAACQIGQNTAFKVTFDTNYVGGSVTSQTVTDGKLVFPTVARTGHLFDGWYLEKECQNKLTDAYTPKKGDVYYANWIALPKSLSAEASVSLMVGDTFTKEDLTVTVTYYDDTSKVLQPGDYTADLSSVTQSSGRKSTQVIYTENDVTVRCMLNVDVAETELVSIAATYVGGMLYVGDTLSPTDIAVTGTYNNGSTGAITEFELRGFDSQTSGQKTVTVACGQITTTVTIEVLPIELVSITASYVGGMLYVGDTLSPTDIAVTGTYNNGSTGVITEFELRGFDSQTSGQKTVTVACGEISTTVTVEVLSVELISISATYVGAQLYVWDVLSAEDIVVIGTYNNGSTGEITEFTLSGFSSQTAGQKIVTVACGEITTTVTVQVLERGLISITATYVGGVLYVGDTLAKTDISVIGNFDNGSTGEITEFTLSGFDSQTAGQKTVTVACGEISTTITVEVLNIELTNIFATYTGGKIFVGDSLLKADISVVGIYNNGERGTITEFELSGFDSQTAGQKTVTVTCGKISTTLNVQVLAIVLERITAQTQTALWVLWGEPLDHSQVVVAAFYNNGTQRVVTEFSDNLAGAVSGERPVTISYTENGVTKTATIVVNVYATLKSISVKYLGDNIVVGDNLDNKYIQVFAYYEDGTAHSVTNFTVGNFSSAVEGTQIVEITYTETNPVTGRDHTVSTTVKIVVVGPTVTSKGDFSVHFLELGNQYTGDSVYIKAGDVDILIDAGSRKDSASAIANYVNKYCTDGKLEYVIVTHAHQDHIAGFVGSSNQGIFDKFVCENIIQFARTDADTQIYKDYCSKRDAEVAAGANLFTALECYNNSKEGAKRIYDLTGDGSITMEILYQKYYEEQSNKNAGGENDYSVCVMFHQGENHYLFTGDLEKDGEESLVNSNPDMPEVVLFKGGHHGSYTASSEVLLNKIKPQYVCICCCAGNVEYTQNIENTFPAQAAIDRIAKYTDRVYVTTLGKIKWNSSTNKWANDGYTSMNGNIVFRCYNGEITVTGSNNNTKLKDTDWFKANRQIPVYWQEGTKTPSMYHD